MKNSLIAFALAGAVSGPALAADAKFDAFMGRVVGNQTTITFGGAGTPLVTSSAHLGNAPAVGNMRVTGDASGVRLEGRANVSVAGSAKTVPVDVKAPFSKANFAKALTVAGKIAWPIGAVLQAGDIYDYLTGLDLSNIRNTDTGITADQVDPSAVRSDGKEYTITNDTPSLGWYSSPQQACVVNVQYWSSKVLGGWGARNVVASPTICSWDIIDNYGDYRGSASRSYTARGSSCPSGSYVTPAGCVQTPPMQSLNESELAAKIASESGWPTKATKALAEALNVPGVGPKIETDTPNIVGPFAVSGEKTSTTEQVKLIPGTTTIAPPGTVETQPGTKTTIKDSSQKLSYKDNVMTAASVTNNTTNITNNVTNETINEGDKITESEQPEILVCGLPGTPPCKIDEAGMPQEKEDTAEKDAKQVIKPLDDFIANPQSVLPELPKINWAFTLPSGCSPIALPAFEPWLQQIDVCLFQPIFHDIMSFVWIMGGIFGAIGTFWRNTFSQG